MALHKFKTLGQMLDIRRAMRAEGRRLAFTNGCFDLIHVGHVRYLARARALADALLVAVNSDRSVRDIKGPLRPIMAEMERAEILAALASVDYVMLFDEPTPQQVIDAIVPDVLVKGADWKISEIVGRETVERAGGVVRNVDLVEGASTTGIIERVLQSFGDRLPPKDASGRP